MRHSLAVLRLEPGKSGLQVELDDDWIDASAISPQRVLSAPLVVVLI
ncbi:hypothetical protein [Cryobacterium sp. M15]|nr:hypothetical protein [Cryobacterium sp. M15]